MVGVKATNVPTAKPPAMARGERLSLTNHLMTERYGIMILFFLTVNTENLGADYEAIWLAYNNHFWLSV